MSKILEGKVAIVTGSRMGIGKAIAIELASQGASVVLNARNTAKLEETAEELRALGYSVVAAGGDISLWEDAEALIQTAISTWGRLDILVNNAGAATRGSIETMSPDVFKNITDINILGSIFPTKAALPWIRQSKGSIVFISSIASFHGLPFNSIYSASKKALTAFSESLRLETAGQGIHVGIAYVGFTENDPQKIIMDADGKLIYLEERKGIKKQTPAQVARIVSRMIQKRTKKTTLSAMGKGLRIAKWLFPGLIHLFFSLNIEKIRANSSGKPNYVEPGS
ncbi:MAG: SDR family oxidoreductase [Bacteroidia bacterium]|nr:SDR family oxidoreductase [Bacteroidia bacterium]